MKKYLLLACLLLSLKSSWSQLIIKGRVKCMNPTLSATKGAENIIIVPAFLPSKSVITATRPSGYFEFNTGIDLANLYEKQISLYVISQCADCKQSVRRVFVSEDQDRKNKTDGKTYFTIPDWMLELNCTRAELAAFRADSILNIVTKQPGVDPDKVSKTTPLLGTPMFLNFLSKLISVVGAIQPNAGDFLLTGPIPGNISYGSFLQSSPMHQSANPGFNFSPNRDYSEATLWNPSAMANSRKNTNISLFTNLKNNGKLSAFTRLSEKITLGIGAIVTRQDEFRKFTFTEKSDPRNFRTEDSMKTTLQESAVYLSGAYQVNEKLSVGLSVKSMWQKMNYPFNLFFTNPGGIATLADTTAKTQRFDADVSATYKVSPSLQVGINVMNLAGSSLYSEVVIPKRSGVALNQRSLGVGVVYKYRRWNFGADLLATQDEFYDAAIGVNYVPFNNALVSAGVSVKQLSYSVAFRLKHFRIAYVEDNGALINDVRPGKIGLVGGRIYGGFVFELE